MAETRKVIPAGSSVAVTLPVEFVRENNIESGQEIYVVKNRKSILYTTDPRIAEELAEPIHTAAEKSMKRGIVREMKE